MQGYVRKSLSPTKPTLFHEFLEEIHDHIKQNTTGEVASYIPELLQVDADNFGITIATVDGYVYQVGESQTPFSIQSISKAFTYGIALTDRGPDAVMSKVDVEPSGEAFNSISLEEETGRPKNPMINAGAIAITGLIDGETSDEKITRILKVFSEYTGHELEVDEKIYLSEKETGHRNRAISHLLRNYEILQGEPEQSLDAYFKQCSILVTCRDLAVMGACLANNGVNPITGIRTLQERYIPNVLSVMASCGMYDYSGNWIYNVGMPAKSGVGGGIVAVLPGQFGLAVYSPRLDIKGNSVRGIAVCEQLSNNLGLHMLHSSRVTSSSVIRSIYTAADVHSKRDRHPDITNYLSRNGQKVLVLELMGELTFVASELIVREIESQSDDKDYLILDFSRVSSIDTSACKIFSDIVSRYLSQNRVTYYVGVRNKYNFSSYIKKQLKDDYQKEITLFDDMDRALEFCEDLIAKEFIVEKKLDQPLAIENQPICQDMSAEEIEYLGTLLTERSHQQDEIICKEGEPADYIYFIIQGKVSAWIGYQEKIRTWLGGSSQGGVFGESALLGNKVRSADVVADTQVTLKLLMANDLLKNESSMAQSVKQKIYRNLSMIYDKKLRRATNQIRTLSQ